MGLHFFGALPYEDDTRPFERVRISKKPIRISIQRELVLTPKKKKASKAEKATTEIHLVRAKHLPVMRVSRHPRAPRRVQQRACRRASPPRPLQHMLRICSREPGQNLRGSHRPLTGEHAAGVLAALLRGQSRSGGQRVAIGDRASGPGRFQPEDSVQPGAGSNEYAQKYNIAGITLFQSVVDTQGHPKVIAVSRPIGFGLDELAVDAIQKASFQPGVRAGKPVPVMVDLLVTFRIYSHRTRGPAAEPAAPGKEQVASTQP